MQHDWKDDSNGERTQVSWEYRRNQIYNSYCCCPGRKKPVIIMK